MNQSPAHHFPCRASCVGQLCAAIMLIAALAISATRPLSAQPAIAAGSLHSLILKADGTLWSCGDNGSGQVGGGTATRLLYPSLVMSGVRAISTQYSHSLILKDDGTAWGCGFNGSGELGLGNTTNRLTPVQIMTGVQAVAAGVQHSLFLKTDGTVWATGVNGNGQLGDNSTQSKSAPAQVLSTSGQALTGVKAIAAGLSHSLFLKTDGTVWFCGTGYSGNGSLTVNQTYASQIATGVKAISATWNHSLLLRDDGSVAAFGENSWGQLGDGGTTARATPVQVMTGVQAISTNQFSSLFLKTDGTAWRAGRVNVAGVTSGTSTPIQVLTNVSAIAAGQNHSLYLKADGSVWGEGTNQSAQLGDGTYSDRATAIQIFNVAAPSYQIVNGSFTWTQAKTDAEARGGRLAIIDTQAKINHLENLLTRAGSWPFLWLGLTDTESEGTWKWLDGTIITTNNWAAGEPSASNSQEDYVYIYPSGSVYPRKWNDAPQDAPSPNQSGYLLEVLKPFSPYGWGTDSAEGRLNTPSGLDSLTKIEGGYNHSVALKSDGTVVAWGNNNGTQGITQVPAGLSSVIDIDAGWNWTVARRSNGTLVSWGANDSAQITQTPTNQSFISVAAGNMHGVALKNDGTVVCWGRGDFGQKTVPAGLNNAIAVAAGGHWTMALKNDGTVAAWGAITNFPPIGLSNISKIAAGDSFGLALRSNGTVVAWGDNTYGQLNIPAGLDNVTSIYATALTAYAIKTDGSVVSWGDNRFGQRNIPILPGNQRWNTIGGGWEHVYGLALIPSAPIITSQPLAVTNFWGATASFLVSVSSTLSPSYQWRKNGVDIPGATTSTLSLASVSLTDAGSYSCLISNSVGSVVSNSANLTVYPETNLTIRTQPASQAIVLGNSVTFSVFATSVDPIGYQWRKNGITIPGATSANYTIAAVTSTDAGNYTCIVSDPDELLLTTAATLIVQTLPAITSQPTSLTVLQNASATFSVAATGTPAPTYQWRFNGSPISGATSASYSIASAQAANAGNYTCVVTNAAGSVTSGTATLTVNIPAAITAQPSSQSVNPAASATFSVTASGTGSLSYQWRKNGRNIAGATSSTLTLSNVRFLDEAKYTCLVSNAFGSALSTVATLTITISPTSPDSDGDTISDALETYLSVFGLDPAVDSTEEWTRLLAMIPDLGAYYTADQMRDLAVGSPTLRRGTNGNFLLDVTVQESTNLNTWTNRALSAPMITYPGGVLRVELPPLDSSTHFYRLRSQAAP